MKILINVPNLNLQGGVAVLYNVLKMEKNYSNVKLCIPTKKYYKLINIILTLVKFTVKTIKADIVHLNPSLNRKSFLRDALFAWITLKFSRKLIVYWHGWEETYEAKIKGSKVLKYIIKNTFLKAHTTIVLGSLFENKIRDLGYKNIIHIETNSAENKYIIKNKLKFIEPHQPVKLLFLSRLEIEKGVYIAIDTLNLLNQKNFKFKLIIAGSGPEEANIRIIAESNKAIEWLGLVLEESKHKLLLTSNILFFPTYYPEGLPINILEGMMYGLPIVTRPVGGITDIIIEKENGFLIDGLTPEENAIKINEIIETSGLYETMSINNQNKSKSFEPQIVRKRLYSYYEEVNNIRN